MAGVTGRNAKSLTKVTVAESKLATQGAKNLRFFHEAAAGETSIPFGALNEPSSLVNFNGNLNNE